MSPLQLVISHWALMAAAMFGLWRWQLRTGEADGVDLGWTVGLGVAAVLYAFGLDRGLPERRLLVAGLPPTEARSVRSRGEDYRKYQRTTNAFFPGPPRPDPAETG